MKAICPISGVPFRTYDSLPLELDYNHPIFAITYDRLVLALEDIRKQEEESILNWNERTLDDKKEAKLAASITDLTNATALALHERNWKNPLFRLYQSKHLVMLAFMNHAELILVEKGYAARPSPEIIDSHFWNATELFSWACTLANPQLRNGIPKYRITRDTERMGNLPEYLEEVSKIKESIGNRFRSASTERQLAAWEMAISILTRRREVLKEKLSTSHNPLAAKWALTITNAPKQYWDFWYAILSSPSTKITFEGVRVGDRIEPVTQGDLRELYDHLDDNLIRPKGEIGEYHRDDSEFYFIARQTVLDIIRTHILILEQGVSSFRIVNQAVGHSILAASDDVLNIKAKEHGLAERPNFTAYPKKVDFIRALAGWRHITKQELLKILQPESSQEKVEGDKEKGKYEIL